VKAAIKKKNNPNPAIILSFSFGIIIAFVTNKMIDSGFSETSDTMKRGSEDTCTYLKDVADHVYHLMMYNYEEMETHVLDQLTRKKTY